MINKNEKRFLSALLVLSIALISWLFLPFLPSIFFALILVASTNFLYKGLIDKYNLSSITSSSIMVSGIALFIVLPFTYLMIEGIIQITNLYNYLIANKDTHLSVESFYAWLENKNIEQEYIAYTKKLVDNNLSVALDSVKNIALVLSKNVFNNTFGFISFMVLTLFCLFYFYIDGNKVLNNLKILSPLNDDLDEKLFDKFTYLASVLTITVFSIALLQGVSFGIIMGIFGMPILFTSTLIAVSSFIPVIGSTLVWAPIAIYFGFEGLYIKMVTTIIWGAVVNGVIIDNILRPVIIKTISDLINKNEVDTESTNPLNHTLIIVLSTFAGIIQFGILGLFSGPILAALAITVFEIYRDYVQEKQNEDEDCEDVNHG